MSVYNPGESIEGDIISGHSRKPLSYKRTRIINGNRYFVYKAGFNVSAAIVKGINPSIRQEDKIEANSIITVGENISCDSALITTFARTRNPNKKDVYENIESHVSHTHGASVWEFKQHTNAMVITPMQSIIDAKFKRNNISIENKDQ